MIKKKNNSYKWNYCSLGGVTRVNIASGEDIAHLGELDQKLWTVLSCPVKGLEFDETTLAMLDTDGDGKIRVAEVVAAAQWLTSAVKDSNTLLKGESTIALDKFNSESEAGKKLLASARQILANLGADKKEISIDDTTDSVAIFKNTKLNGDGIVTEASTDDEALKAVIKATVEHVGQSTDRSGAAGVNADQVEAFYTALADYAAWQAAAEADKANVFPYGDNTEAALNACNALKDKIADYFMRCKLISFDSDAAAAVDVSVEKITAIGGLNLATQAEEIAKYPVARPSKTDVLPFNAINPAWQAAFDNLKALVLDVDFVGKEGITEAEWNATLAKFAAYTAWKGAKKGDAVEPLGLDCVKAMLAEDRKADLLALIAADKALEEESNSIDAVNRFMHLYRDFYKFLCNYVIMTDFYASDKNRRAVFEAGELYIDQRCCKLCIRVADMGKHADMAKLSGMFLIYCSCTSKAKGQTMDIVAVMTAGSIRNLRPGTNGVFYSRDGQDWDAVVTKIVDNPISVKQAFWSPYRKLANFISDKINKSAAEKDANSAALLQSKLGSADAAGATAKQPFDIGKFAGIFAAIGLAVSALGVALTALVKGIVALKWWQLILVIVVIMAVISGPACFMAWLKLRKRDLGPVLNANGWAVNSSVLVNILFGSTLTNLAKYPKLKLEDPYREKMAAWKKWLIAIVVVLAAAFAALWFTDNLGFIGISRKAEAEETEQAVGVAVEEDVPVEAEIVVETPAEQ